MRFMILIKSDEETENGAVPDERLINEMGMFNARLEKAGILRAAEGLTSSREGAARVTITGERRTVTDGPFAEAKELVAGFWIIDVGSLAEAVEWAGQVPSPDGTTRLEVRRVVEADDFGDAFTPEARAAEERLRERLAKRD